MRARRTVMLRMATPTSTSCAPTTPQSASTEASAQPTRSSPESGVVHAVSALCAGNAKASVRAASAPSRSTAARSAASEALTSST